MRSHRKLTLGAIYAVVLFGFAAIPACSSDDTDTATGQSDEETTTTESETTTTEAGTTTTVAAATTAVTTGRSQAITDKTYAELQSGEATADFYAEVTLDDGSTKMIGVDEDILMSEIWPDGVAAEGVTVNIEEVNGEEQITGRAG